MFRPFDLRYYQDELCGAVYKVWETHQAAAVIACTGSGKTEIYMHLATQCPGRVLVIAHRDYLLNQPIERLAKHGFDDIAIEKGEETSEGYFHKTKIVFASIQSISIPRRLATFRPDSFDLVIVDEGHRAVADSYMRTLKHLCQNKRLKVLIVTATPKRKDNIALGNICDGDIAVAGTYSPGKAADEGWIVPLRFFRREVEGLDFSNVKMKGTDLDPDQVEALLMQEKPLHAVCASLAEDQGSTIVFCPGVAVARAYATLMNSRYRPGRASVLWGDSDDITRDREGQRLAQGEIDYIFNVDLMTEGFDVPELSRVVWAAPTASLVRFTQGTGRVFRPHSSVKSLLTGGRDDSAARRLLISQSPKPFGSVVTYYPQNCKHQLCEPNDILGGDDLPPEIRNLAKQVQEATAAQPAGSDPEEDIETAKAMVELRALLDTRRKEIKAKAKVEDTEYDGFGGSRNRALGCDAKAERKAAKQVSEDWPGGDLASPKQIGWMKYNKIPNAAKLGITKYRACCIRDLMTKANFSPESALACSRKQAMAILKKFRAPQ